MKALHPIFILAIAYVAVFLEASFGGIRHVLGVQIDLLPALMVYTGLNYAPFMIGLSAVFGGLLFDSFSLNPLGVSMLPLLCIGLVVYRGREILSRDDPTIQFFFGMAASAAQPLAVLFILMNLGTLPLLGWKSLWQWIVLALGGGLFTPVCFALCNRLHLAFDYQPAAQAPFRADRQIKRGRS